MDPLAVLAYGAEQAPPHIGMECLYLVSVHQMVPPQTEVVDT